MLFIASWLAEKFFYDFGEICILILDGKIMKGLLLAVLAYGVYYACACAIMHSGSANSGKVAVMVIVAFSLYGVYQDIQEYAGAKHVAEFIGTTIVYLLCTIDDTLRIIATLHAMNDEL